VNPEVNGVSEPLSDSGKEPGREPFSGSSPKLNRLIDSVRSLEQWYTADFERRMASLTELLKSHITEELRSQFSSELDSRVEQIREQYEERLYEQASRWQSQRETLDKEIEELRRKVPSNDVQQEIAIAEEAVNRLTHQGGPELERQIPDAASLTKVVQSKVEELEMKAYLRGLKFQTS
jgi:DNA repair exonuclease SbcCD ATPase subunit